MVGVALPDTQCPQLTGASQCAPAPVLIGPVYSGGLAALLTGWIEDACHCPFAADLSAHNATLCVQDDLPRQASHRTSQAQREPRTQNVLGLEENGSVTALSGTKDPKRPQLSRSALRDAACRRRTQQVGSILKPRLQLIHHFGVFAVMFFQDGAMRSITYFCSWLNGML